MKVLQRTEILRGGAPSRSLRLMRRSGSGNPPLSSGDSSHPGSADTTGLGGVGSAAAAGQLRNAQPRKFCQLAPPNARSSAHGRLWFRRRQSRHPSPGVPANIRCTRKPRTHPTPAHSAAFQTQVRLPPSAAPRTRTDPAFATPLRIGPTPANGGAGARPGWAMIGALPKRRCNRELSQTCLQGSPWRCRRKRRQPVNSTFPPSPIQAAKLCLLGDGQPRPGIRWVSRPVEKFRNSHRSHRCNEYRDVLLQIRFGGMERRAADPADPKVTAPARSSRGGAARPVMPAGWAGIARWRVAVTGSTRRRSRCFHRSVRFRPGGSGSGCLSRRRVCWFRSSHFRTGGNPGGPSAFASSPDPGRSCLG